jgi:DNA-binding NtrC family response regulator
MTESIKKRRIIIIDDEEDWGVMLKMMAESRGYIAEYVNKPQDAREKIKLAHDKGEPYLIATIDRKFKIGEKGIEIARGVEVLDFIKEHYEYIACIMVSGDSVSPEEILDLRDNHNLDYFLQKDRVEIDSLLRAIDRAMQRIHPRDPKDQIKLLEDALKTEESNLVHLLGNLSFARKKAAQKGIDVDVATRNEIENYTEEIKQAKLQIEFIENEIKKINLRD